MLKHIKLITCLVIICFIHIHVYAPSDQPMPLDWDRFQSEENKFDVYPDETKEDIDLYSVMGKFDKKDPNKFDVYPDETEKDIDLYSVMGKFDKKDPLLIAKAMEAYPECYHYLREIACKACEYYEGGEDLALVAIALLEEGETDDKRAKIAEVLSLVKTGALVSVIHESCAQLKDDQREHFLKLIQDISTNMEQNFKPLSLIKPVASKSLEQQLELKEIHMDILSKIKNIVEKYKYEAFPTINAILGLSPHNRALDGAASQMHEKFYLLSEEERSELKNTIIAMYGNVATEIFNILERYTPSSDMSSSGAASSSSGAASSSSGPAKR